MADSLRAPLILSVFSTFEAGGAQTRFVSLANRFGASLRHAVIAMDGKTSFSSTLSPSLDVRFHPVNVRKGAMLANRDVFRNTIKSIAPDILVTHNWGTIEWALANTPKLVRHIHCEDGFGPDETHGQIARRVWTRRLVLRRSTVIVPSRNLLRIAREIWRLPERSLRYIPNGIDCAKFARLPDTARTALWPGEGKTIGTVTVLRTEKNLKRLIRAFALTAKDVPCRLVILGEGSERAALQSLAAELNLQERMHFAGFVQDPESFYGAFDIFSLASDTEQMPYTIVEAMAAGRAIAATDVGDISLMVSPENRPYIVPCEDEALAAAFRALIADDERRAAIGAANRARAIQDFDQQQMFDAYARLFGV